VNAWARRGLLFVMAAWPAWIVSCPPLQDLPNHLATAHVQLGLERYPELVSNGFFKTNSTLFAFLHVAGAFMSLRMAAKLFVTLGALVSAVAYPATARALGGNEESASLVLLPMIHSWFVAMGMLDYALAVPLVLLTLGALAAHRRAPSLLRGASVCVLALAVWYTHAFAVGMLALLAAIEIVATKRWRDVSTFALPLAPAIALTAWSSMLQLGSETTFGEATVYQGAGALLYGAFAEWMWSLTKWTLASVVSAGVIAFYGLRRMRERPPFFSPIAMAVLVILYATLPYHAHRWFYVSSRVVPFLWVGLLLRVPSELPPWLRNALVASTLAFSVGLGIEYVIVAKQWEDFTRAEDAVPTRARLLPLVFDRKGPHGDNTWPMLHVWGLYVVDRDTTAPLLFAHSRSFPVSYAQQPPPRFHGLLLEQFPQTMRTPETFCKKLEDAGIARGDCAASYARAWDEFWTDARPRFDRVIMYGPSAETRAAIPSSFRVVYDRDETLVLATSPE